MDKMTIVEWGFNFVEKQKTRAEKDVMTKLTSMHQQRNVLGSECSSGDVMHRLEQHIEECIGRFPRVTSRLDIRIKMQTDGTIEVTSHRPLCKRNGMGEMLIEGTKEVLLALIYK